MGIDVAVLSPKPGMHLIDSNTTIRSVRAIQ